MTQDELTKLDGDMPMISLAFQPRNQHFEPDPENFPGWSISFHVTSGAYRDHGRHFHLRTPEAISRNEALAFFRRFDRAAFMKSDPAREWYDSYYELTAAKASADFADNEWYYSVVTPFTD